MGKGKQRFGEWSELEYSEEWGRWFRVRYDLDGHPDYEWVDPPDDDPPPRSRRDDQYEDEDDLHQRMSNVRLDSVGSDPRHYHSRSERKSERSEKSSRKHRQSEKSGSGPSNELTLARSNESHAYADGYADGYAYESYGQEPHYTEEFNEDLRIAQEESRRHHHSATLGMIDYSSGHDAGGPSNNAYERYDEEDDGRSTPKGHKKNANKHQEQEIAEGFMRGLEKLDPRYRIEHSNRFQPGDIFKAYWAEPSGHNKDGSTVTSKQQVESKYGMFWVGFRRFIVIANDDGNCTCLPILTYSGRGCNKKGVKPAKHGMIYQRGRKPHRLDGEPAMGLPPVAATMNVEGEKLAKASRINYAKLVTIEHNTPVFFIGYISGDDFELLVDGQNRIWNEKEMRRKHHHGRRG